MRLNSPLLAASLFVLAGFTNASGVTGNDVLAKMTEKEQFGYITGTIDTMIYLEQVQSGGPSTRSGCIHDWYYGKDAPGPRQVVAMFKVNGDKPAVGLIKILIDRACGKSS
jgi:hypothetical protein